MEACLQNYRIIITLFSVLVKSINKKDGRKIRPSFSIF